ncbi:MAG: indole-3-glycerol-phosphate synthase [Gemmatimonadales bacterium]
MTELQASTLAWAFPVGPLGELTAAAEGRAAALLPVAGELERAVAAASAVPSLASALSTASVSVIAELKRRSPSKGVMNDSLDAPGRALAYVSGGAAALSVLTEPVRFGGSLDDLRAVRRATHVPLLRKDFIVDRLQLLEARAAGASAVLLIARALPPLRLGDLATAAIAIGLEVLLEVRTEAELECALRVESAIIGVNNRNLETLVIDASVGASLLPLVPRTRIAVSESGVTSRADVEAAASLGVDAVLVGSVLTSAADGTAAVAALANVARRPRGH